LSTREFRVGEILLYRVACDTRFSPKPSTIISMDEFLANSEDDWEENQRRYFILGHYFQNEEYRQKVLFREYLLFEQLKLYENNLNPDKSQKLQIFKEILNLSLHIEYEGDFIELGEIFLKGANSFFKGCIDPIQISRICREKKYVELIINLLVFQCKSQQE
jgi:hypothetical protein